MRAPELHAWEKALQRLSSYSISSASRDDHSSSFISCSYSMSRQCELWPASGSGTDLDLAVAMEHTGCLTRDGRKRPFWTQHCSEENRRILWLVDRVPPKKSG